MVSFSIRQQCQKVRERERTRTATQANTSTTMRYFTGYVAQVLTLSSVNTDSKVNGKGDASTGRGA